MYLIVRVIKINIKGGICIKYIIAIIDRNEEFLAQSYLVVKKIMPDSIINKFTDLQSFFNKEQRVSYNMIFIAEDIIMKYREFIISKSVNKALVIIALNENRVNINLLNNINSNEKTTFKFVEKQKFELEILKIRNDIIRQCNLPFNITLKSIEGGIKTVNLRKVVVIYTEGHNVCFKMRTEIIKSRISVDSINDKLNSNNFVRVRSNTFVNLNYVKLVSRTEIKLNCSEPILISKRYRQKFLAALFNR